MAYFLVMGGLVLSVCFTAGWGLMRGLGWLTGRLKGGKGATPRRGRKAATPKRAARKPAGKQAAGTAAKPAKKPRDRTPWRLTRWLARVRSAVPLSLLALLLYGLTRLAEYGMATRPHDPPGGYHDLVSVLGWIAAGLLAIALINLLASWRCHHLARR